MHSQRKIATVIKNTGTYIIAHPHANQGPGLRYFSRHVINEFWNTSKCELAWQQAAAAPVGRGLTRWQSRAHQQINSDLVKAAVVLNRLEAKLDILGPS